LRPLHVEGLPQAVEEWVEEQAFVHRYDAVGVRGEKTQAALWRYTELGVVAVSPRLGGTDDRLDVYTVQATQAGQLIDYHLMLELGLCLVGDVLEVAATTFAGAKVGARRLDAVR
jgi:hypothetical protein